MKSPFAIPFVGLKQGIHEFEFDIDKSFFESLPYSLIENGRLSAYLELEKKETMLIAQLDVVGFIFTDCDRCTEPLTQEIEGDMTLYYYTFGEEESEDENLLVLAPESYQIDLTQPLYELISLSLPAKMIHEEGECNEEMVELINKYQQPSSDSKTDDDEIDPRWSALKNLN